MHESRDRAVFIGCSKIPVAYFVCFSRNTRRATGIISSIPSRSSKDELVKVIVLQVFSAY